jgi:RNA polymerase sigma factor (TIGR02999 family)
MTSQKGITALLIESSGGDKAALNELLPLVYTELRRIATLYMQRERADHTLQATALVHEAYVRLVDQQSVDWQNRAQFFGLAAQMMRRILVNHAESHKAAKRGGGAHKLSLDETISFFAEQNLDLLNLNDALTRLAKFDEEKSRIVELRFFGGLTVTEVAEVLKRSTATIEREWALARAWLYREISNTETEE